MLLLYTADDSNVHQVEPVTAGERATLTMWLTLDQQHQEDRKVRSSSSSSGVGSGMQVHQSDTLQAAMSCTCKWRDADDSFVQGLSCLLAWKFATLSGRHDVQLLASLFQLAQCRDCNELLPLLRLLLVLAAAC
jgi:hypothetical protein